MKATIVMALARVARNKATTFTDVEFLRSEVRKDFPELRVEDFNAALHELVAEGTLDRSGFEYFIVNHEEITV